MGSYVTSYEAAQWIKDKHMWQSNVVEEIAKAADDLVPPPAEAAYDLMTYYALNPQMFYDDAVILGQPVLTGISTKSYRGVEAQLVDLFPAIKSYRVNNCPADLSGTCVHCNGECDCDCDPAFGCGECDCYEDSCDYSNKTLSSCIQHLNDEHQWSRQQIADWLETLDVDLTMSATPKGN